MDPKTKKQVLSNMSAQWKIFKGELTRLYVRPFRDEPDQLKHRPEMYKKYIEQEDWEEFVKVRISKGFEVYSKWLKSYIFQSYLYKLLMLMYL